MIQIGDFLYAPVVQETYTQMLHSLSVAQPADGLIVEFGVYQGASINVIAKANPKCIIHGFDSFVGLPGKWERGLNTYEAGHFSVNGAMPRVPANVKLHKGWFKD